MRWGTGSLRSRSLAVERITELKMVFGSSTETSGLTVRSALLHFVHHFVGGVWLWEEVEDSRAQISHRGKFRAEPLGDLHKAVSRREAHPELGLNPPDEPAMPDPAFDEQSRLKRAPPVASFGRMG